MARELPKAYEPKQVEAKWYPAWEEQGFYHAEVDPSRPAWPHRPPGCLLMRRNGGGARCSWDGRSRCCAGTPPARSPRPACIAARQR